MARRNNHELAFAALSIEGALLAPDFLNKVAHLDAAEQSEADYDIPRGLKLRDEIGRYWKIAQNLWQDFSARRQRADMDSHVVTVRDFLEPFCRQVLGFADMRAVGQVTLDERVFPIGFAAGEGRVPLVFAASDQALDKPSTRHGDGVRRRSPFLLAQEYLNASGDCLWAVVSNGLKLRILRDNPSLTRPAYIEADLEALFNEGLYPDFTALWLLAHASRFGKVGAEPADCALERWRNTAQEDGIRARDRLRVGVTEALRSLGTGFLAHRDNAELRRRIESGELSTQAYFEQLLRLIYRFIFLATIEDRELVFAPEATQEARERYLAGYSLTRLRQLAARRRSYDRHADLWQVLTITFGGLGRGQPALGLPALGGLFDAAQCPDLNIARLENQALLSALFSLCFFRDGAALSRVNYRDMDSEELGSVYESLLELVPQVTLTGGIRKFGFIGDEEEGSTRGNARKLTGSYYTPDSLVQELIKSALEPVIVRTLAESPQEPVKALLALTVCDPACGSGHFLLAAARRIADEVALLRASEGNPTEDDFRHALRDVVAHCIYGVDKNPMAVELARTALWLEAYTPDRPLSFIDHHLRVGDALLGVLDPKVLEQGIPDEAYTALSGDDKEVAKALKKQNKADLKSWRQIASGDLLTQSGLAAQAVSVETLDDDTLEHLEAKRQAWSRAEAEARHSTFGRLADTYVAAFLAPKLAEAGDMVPLSGYLWGVMSGQTAIVEMEDAAQALCHQHSVFHWWLAFPQVAARGGFSVMLGNPPWERIKLQEEEFFATRSALVAQAKNKAERTQRIEWLREGVLLHRLSPDLERAEGLTPPNRAEMALYASFIAARRGAEAASLYAHDSRRYPLTGVGDVNTYALFAETFLQATAPSGRAGFIVPTGIATDDSTKAYFERLATGGHLRSLLCLENEEFVFPSVHHAFRFALLTLGGEASGDVASLVFFARQPEQIHDPRRRFVLTPDEFALINPNTRTCPVFRSERDAELTKKLYHAAPVLIEEALTDAEGTAVRPEKNPWGIRFQTMFHMSSDSGLFADVPSVAGQPVSLPLYEAKMIHQFDHRWATYVDASSGIAGEVETADVGDAQKADPACTVRPRYWVDEREVLARIARVPSRVAKAWLLTHQLGPCATIDDEKSLKFAVATWLAGEWMRRLCADELVGGSARVLAEAQWRAMAEIDRSARPLLGALRSARGGEDINNWTKWAKQDADTPLMEAEETAIQAWQETFHGLSSEGARIGSLLNFVDEWMDRRSPRWLMGWRDITGVEKVRTVIGTVVPRVGVGHTLPLYFSSGNAARQACLLSNWQSLVFDYVARQKVGGTHLTYGYLKQFPVLPPDRYTSADLAFIVPRVLELTYTAHDLQAWGEDLAAYDVRPAAEQGQPFVWNPERRARLRAELDAYYARLYGLTRDELRYILDPADVMGIAYPGETFRVLREGEMRAYNEYRTRRLVLEAWDQQTIMSSLAQSGHVSYSEHGMIRNAEEGRLAGLVTALVAERTGGISLVAIQSAVAGLITAAHYLGPVDGPSLEALRGALEIADVAPLLGRILPIVQRLEVVGVLVRSTRGGEPIFTRGSGTPPGDVILLPEHHEAARLLWLAEGRRMTLEREQSVTVPVSPKATGTQ
ncbi:Eco57I restriction-modification methylase domain-containing protein [Zoogloea dura]|uniref:site-specific DNA-methyltransferase (adenine-specific) n=1 Tax=Zoogloea dura TaxID=2728840 RepID=A0A848G4J5_9RHOO|nr:N-6 DNA methylase [Zoogloea dura]NML26159.1 N-6 DNA methylase [Zoogloea dura]